MRKRIFIRTAVAVVCCLAMAVASASASAAGFVAGKYSATVVGKQTTNIVFTSSFGSMTCGMPEIQGELTQASEALTTSVSATTCSIFGEAAPVAMNGCSFTFHPGSGEGLAGTMDIGPANCGPITITSKIYGVFRIYPKTGMKTVTFANAGSGSTASVNLTMSVSGLKYSLPGSTITENGQLSGQWNLTASSGGSQVSLKALAQLPAGFFLTGKGGEAGNLPRFDAERYPLTITGRQTTEPVFGTAAGDIRCRTTLSGPISSATSDLHLGATYEKCIAFSFYATPKMNGCEYVLHVANSGPPYTGSLELACANAGEGLEFVTEICTMKFPAQTLGTATYENVGEGSSRRVTVKISGTAVQYSGCGTSGSTGTYSGAFSMEGSY